MVLGELLGVLRLAFTFRLDAGPQSWAVTSRSRLLWIAAVSALRATLEALRVDEPLTLDLRGAPDVAAVLAAVARHRLAAREAPHQDFVPAYVVARVRLSAGGRRGRLGTRRALVASDVRDHRERARGSRGALFLLRADALLSGPGARMAVAGWESL